MLTETAKGDEDIVVLCNNSGGSASLTPFVDACPDQFVGMSITEQNLISVSVGLAKCDKRPSVVSPACFLSARSYEQIKMDTTYPDTNVKLIGIDGDVSYGALGMSHHSAQDIATLSTIPNMRVYLPSGHFQTACLMEELLKDDKPAYIRVDGNAVEGIYEEGDVPFSMDRATALSRGRDVAIVACGEMVRPALDAGRLLGESETSAGVAGMYCVKPLDEETVRKAAEIAKLVMTVEEHVPFSGLDSGVSQVVSACCPRMVVNLSLSDGPVTTGTPAEVFEYYGLTGQGIARRIQELLRQL